MLSTLLQRCLAIVMQIKLSVVVVDVPSTFFISFPNGRPFSTCMNQNFCTNCIYVFLEQSVSKNNVTERSSESFGIDDVNGNGRASN